VNKQSFLAGPHSIGVTLPCVATPAGLVLVKSLRRVQRAVTPARTDIVVGLVVYNSEGEAFPEPRCQLFLRRGPQPSSKSWSPFPDFSRGSDPEYLEDWMSDAASDAAEELTASLLVPEVEDLIGELRDWADEAEEAWTQSGPRRVAEGQARLLEVVR